MAEEHAMITPFLSELLREVDGNRIISAGASSYGYDMRLADDGFRIFSSVHAKEIDPKRFDEQFSLIEPQLHSAEDGAKFYLLPPHHYGLGVTVETFKMPRNVLTRGRACWSTRRRLRPAGRDGSLSRSQTSQTCRFESMSMKGSDRSFSLNRMKNAPLAIPTGVENIRAKQA